MAQTLDDQRKEAAVAAFGACQLGIYHVTEVNREWGETSSRWDITCDGLDWAIGFRAMRNDGAPGVLDGVFSVEFEPGSATIVETMVCVDGRMITNNAAVPDSGRPTTAIGYLEEFKSWEDVARQFSIDMPEPEEVLLAIYEIDSYDGEAMVVYRQGNNYFLASGNHCSCFGLENQWSPEEYDLETFKKVVERWAEGSRGSLTARFAKDLMADLATRIDDSSIEPTWK